MNIIAAAIIGIAIIVLLIAVCKVHPFLSLLAGSFAMEIFTPFSSGASGSRMANWLGSSAGGMKWPLRSLSLC